MRSPSDTQPYEPLDVRLARDASKVDALLAQLQADFEEERAAFTLAVVLSLAEPFAADEAVEVEPMEAEPVGFDLVQ